MSQVHDAAFWDERYSSSAAIWSGKPNPHLVSGAIDLTPGKALDVGSGEGADAIWLAAAGWEVTAVDHSQVALARSAEHAAQAGDDVAARISWEQADVTDWEPGEGIYDLVSAQFMHLPSALRIPLFARLAASVAPGGSLLVVGHNLSDRETPVRGHFDADSFWAGADIVASLDPDAWDVLANTSPGRTVVHEGAEHAINDTVVHARRKV
ncbi:class I SAM-dependent methyltransferase [Sanguibacter antarcticus]|uniref:Methyltransferase family protein n=1 Tax=Sanguibacter antarcticus TaxID=372484 RepID=A0A2A9E6D7_9MICO|nr:class I SAM-dependent methyltransferase [Sanguibacter antarcticus]PFG34617.1 methyltransferase family protein [Sanguibacter antarcticus]